jgi:3-dehydroquinate synthase
MNKFTIADTVLEADPIKKDCLLIQSHPNNYEVLFQKFTNTFGDNEVVLVDANVQRLYNIQHSKLITIEAIEANKNIDTVLLVCEKLLNFGFDRGDTLVVIGGGITQDIGAYTAKTFKRGINWVFYPTTLLSQCDSCIGGKTALNFKTYKNQLALFSAPSRVIIDTNFLTTLTEQDILSGHGEIVKLFLTGGQYYIDNFDSFDLETKIYHSLSIKKAVVELDEFELLERKSLNYGHSFGHAIEAVTNYEIPHGEAVLLGIEIINKLYTQSQDISNLISRFTSLSKLRQVSIDQVVNAMKTDKKVANGVISLIVVPQAGTTIFVKQSFTDHFTTLVHDVLTN